jgi:hypothetical protein
MLLCKFYTSSTLETSKGFLLRVISDRVSPQLWSNVDLFLRLNADDELMLLSGKN